MKIKQWVCLLCSISVTPALCANNNQQISYVESGNVQDEEREEESDRALSLMNPPQTVQLKRDFLSYFPTPILNDNLPFCESGSDYASVKKGGAWVGLL